MIQSKEQQFCRTSLSTLFDQAYECEIRVVGSLKEIFQHKRYIVEVYLKKQLVMRCLKRYSEFEALYEVIRMNFKNIDLTIGSFPSKFQVLNRQETRRSYFEEMLNQIIHIYCEKITNQTNRRLLSTAFVFLVGEQIQSSKITKFTSVTSSSDGNQIISKNDGQKDRIIEDFMAVHYEKELLSKKASFNKIEDSNSKKNGQGEYDISDEIKFRAFIATEFLVRFEDEPEWKQRYLKIENSCLLVYKHKNQNHFKSKVQLYQAKVEYLHREKNIFDHFCEKMELDNEPTFQEDTSVIAISHQYDYKKLLIKIKQGDQKLDIKTARELLRKASHQTTISENIEGVFSPIGKLFIVLHKIVFEPGNKKSTPIIYLRIKCSGLQYETKRMTYSTTSLLNIKQGFMIPISNSFANILIEVIMIENDGIIRHQSEQKVVGRYRICFSDFISYPEGYGLEKIHARTELQNDPLVKYESVIELSVMNYSHFSSIYGDSYANQNDGILMAGLKSASDTQELVITVDRVLRIIGNIALFIQAFWRNVYLFKYPRMGYFFFSCLILLFLFGNAGTIFQIIISLILGAMIYNIPSCKIFISSLMKDYVFKYRHLNFKEPVTLSNNQLKFLKWTSHLQKIKEDYTLTINGKLEKKQEAKDKKYEYWIFNIHGKQFKIREELPGLIEKVFEVKKIVELVLRMISAVINTVEKICNVFSWADPRRTIIIFGLLFLISNVANIYLLRAIGCLFCTHRLVKGLNFYEIKHYTNNRKLATYSLRYIINKQFSYLLLKDKKITTTKQVQIEQIMTDILFPIKDEEKLKKLRHQIEEILGVYIDPEEMQFRAKDEKKNGLRIIHLVEMIETCESRLKLEWISGQQGVNDDFQELKRLTKEYLVMDLWIESLLINFFLNTPSQLYTTFRPIRTQQSLRCEKAQDKIGDYFTKLRI